MVDTLLSYAFYFVISLPVAGPAVLACLRTDTKHPKGRLLIIFKNRYAGIGVSVFAVLAGFTLFFLAAYLIGGCSGGFEFKANCTLIANDAGSVFFTCWYLAYQYITNFGLPAVVFCGLAEMITRFRITNTPGDFE